VKASPGEFELIDVFFKSKTHQRDDVPVGIGDDAAVVEVPADQQLVLAMDTIIAGTHFFENSPAASIGHRALCVNLSDLAAMGATPSWFTLALTIPQVDREWLAEFSRGMMELAERYSVQCIGGDTTQGKLSITIQAHGFVPRGKAILRSTAQVGDAILVTGTLGGTAYAIDCVGRDQAIDPSLLPDYLYPEPQIKAGMVLRQFATSMIDISDGLAGDTQHILTASGVGAEINCGSLPMPDILLSTLAPEQAWRFALMGGDDYQLCFTVPSSKVSVCQTALKAVGVSATQIGHITATPTLKIHTPSGQPFELPHLGFQHFREK